MMRSSHAGYIGLALFPFAVMALSQLFFVYIYKGSALEYQKLLYSIAFGVVMLGCTSVMLTFKMREYLFWSWFGMFLCMATLMTSNIIWDIMGRIPSASILASIGFILWAFSVFLMAKAWSIAGLKLPGSKWTVLSLSLIFLLVSLGLVGYELIYRIRLIFSEPTNLVTIERCIRIVSEIAALTWIAPIFLTALSMHTGKLIWPWGFLTVGIFMRLLMISMISFGRLINLDPMISTIWSDYFCTLGLLYLFSAGLAQSFIQRDIKKLHRNSLES